MNISGSVGFTLLKNEILNKYVLLLADVHDGVSYCYGDSEDSTFIDKWLMTKSMENNNDILLEEVFREYLKKLTELWPSSPHTQNLKNLSINNKKIKLVDIRPLLIPFSWELCDTNELLGKFLFKKYLEILDNLFNFRRTPLMMRYILPQVLKLRKKYKKTVVKHFYEIKDLYSLFTDDYKYLMDKDLMYILKYDSSILEKINNILSLVMEWYIILLIHNSSKNSIIHIGLAHSNRVLDLLLEVYNYKIINQQGINKMEDTYKPLHSCINLNKTINNIF
jgi:hypothetical protein